MIKEKSGLMTLRVEEFLDENKSILDSFWASCGERIISAALVISDEEGESLHKSFIEKFYMNLGQAGYSFKLFTRILHFKILRSVLEWYEKGLFVDEGEEGRAHALELKEWGLKEEDLEPISNFIIDLSYKYFEKRKEGLRKVWGEDDTSE